MGLEDFFSREAGQKRRNWLDGKSQDLADAARYYAGPYAPNLGLVAEMNPVQDVSNAMQSGRQMLAPTGQTRIDNFDGMVPFDYTEHTPQDVLGDGQNNTEFTMTERSPDGGVWNIPSIWWDKEGKPTKLDVDQAWELAKWFEEETGATFPRFDSFSDGSAYSQERSAKGGASNSYGYSMPADPTMAERMGHGVDMLTNTAAAVAPAVAGKVAKAYNPRMADDAVQWLEDALMGFSVNPTKAGLGKAAGDFVGDESGAFRVWHGSPHDFDKFSMDKIGSGEGAQAYGHGLYFAESEDVAKEYAEKLAPANANVQSTLRRHAGDFDVAIGEAESRIAHYEAMEASRRRDSLLNINRLKLEELRRQKSGLKPDMGRTYEVGIDANPEDFLDWDALLTDQPTIAKKMGYRTKSVQDLDDEVWAIFDKYGDIEKMPPEARGQIEALTDEMALPAGTMTGEAAYSGGDEISHLQRTVSGKSYSADDTSPLRDAGIPGIRYKDGDSRGADGGTSNYVLFDDSKATILSKNGEKTPQGQAQDVLDLLSQGRASEVTDPMMAAADDMYLFNNYDLPMDEASRMARAEEMGFDRQPLYHGTASDFQSFDPQTRGKSTKAVSARSADWLTGRADVAGPYADLAAQKPVTDLMELSRQAEIDGKWDLAHDLMAEAERVENAGGVGQNIIQAYGPSDVMRFNADGQSYDPTDYPLMDKVKSARDGGHDAVRIDDFVDNADWGSGRTASHVGVFNPANIRSRFARFDPRLKHLSNLSAGVAGGAVALDQVSDDQNKQDIIEYLRSVGAL